MGSPFWKGMKQDWSLPYSGVTQHLDQVGKIYAVYDPYIEQDRLHTERIQHPNLVPLRRSAYVTNPQWFCAAWIN